MIRREPTPWISHGLHPRRAGVSAFGFGGSNFHAVLEEYQAEKDFIDWDSEGFLFAAGGESPQDLAFAIADALEKYPAVKQESYLREIRNKARVGSAERIAIFSRSWPQLKSAMESAVKALELGSDPVVDGDYQVYRGSGEQDKLAVLFFGARISISQHACQHPG